MTPRPGRGRLGHPPRLVAVIGWLLVVCAVVVAGVPGAAAQEDGPGAADERDVVIELYWGEGCPYCAAERELLAELAGERPEVEVLEYEVWRDDANRALLAERAAAAGFTARAVPVTFIGDRYWVGFDAGVEAAIRAEVDRLLGAGTATPEDIDEARALDVPFVGEWDTEGRSLLAVTVVIGFVDGVNPCSLWVLSMLLALVVHQGSRRRVAAVGVTFLVVTALLYGLYIVGIYSALSYVAHLDAIRAVVAVVALVAGLVNLKDYLWFGRGPSLTIPESRKPEIYRRMRAAARGRSLPAALAATVVLAVGVSLLETPCTAGLPVLWTDLLVEQEVGVAAATGLFAVYMAVFLLDELAVFAVAVVALRATKVQELHGRVLKLVGGSLMVTLAAVLVLAPDLMDSVAGAMVVLGAAVVVAASIAAADRVVRPPVGV